MEERKNSAATGNLFSFLTLKDLIAILSVAISIAMAWGIFSTRLALLEQQLAVQKEEMSRTSNEIKILNNRVASLERTSIESSFILDNLWRSARDDSKL